MQIKHFFIVVYLKDSPEEEEEKKYFKTSFLILNVNFRWSEFLFSAVVFLFDCPGLYDIFYRLS